MERNCSWQISWSDLELQRPTAQEFARCSEKLQIELSPVLFKQDFLASYPCEVMRVLTMPTTFHLPPNYLHGFGWDLPVRNDLCMCHNEKCLHTTVMRFPSVGYIRTRCLQGTRKGEVLSISQSSSIVICSGNIDSGRQTRAHPTCYSDRLKPESKMGSPCLLEAAFVSGELCSWGPVLPTEPRESELRRTSTNLPTTASGLGQAGEMGCELVCWS